MTLKASQTQNIQTTRGESELDAEKRQEAEDLKAFFAKMKKHDRELAELREPVNKKSAAFKAEYDMMEKKGYDRAVLKFLHKKRDGFSPEFRFTANVYLSRIGEQLPLFDVADTVKH